jgi:sugar phosphate isomerase/epimerase
MTRRTFVQTSVAAAVGSASALARGATPNSRILLGLCSGPGNADKLKAIGFDFIEGGVGSALKPNAPDAEYAPELEKIKSCGLPMRSCNGFLPKELRLTGPDEGLRHDDALAYAVKACERADQVGLTCIVFGSGGARNAPEGFDLGKAREQFIAFCKRLGPAIADRKVTIVLEPLNKKEANFLTTVAEGIEMTDEIGHPRIRLLADIYHMMKDGEQPDSIRKAGARILHCHVAELEGRKFPGNTGEDLRAYYRALRDIGYTGGISCECGWPKENVEEAWKKAYATLREQVYG